jgi:acid stress-induced BolA-like protein IbaG/YrbA
MDPRAIAALIEKNLDGSSAVVRTDGQGHYEAMVVAASFAGKRTLARHQMVYGALGGLVGNEIHALQLKTLTPEEMREVSD